MTHRILISLPKGLLDELDAYAKKHRYNRSEFIRYAIREIIAKEDDKED
jgi:metal-responsive CopG/Arc/MetJ family transcriptional regulator